MKLDSIVKRINSLIKTYNEISPRSEIHGSALLKGATLNGKVKVGEGVKLVKGVHITGNVTIGKFTTVNGPNTDIHAKVNPVSIGNFCSIARNVSIQEFNHKLDRISTYFIDTNVFGEKSIVDNIASNGKVQIENDVWIGTQCVILSGAHIDNGAVVAANSVVTGYVPPYAIVGGSPAKIIKYRFDPEIIELLNELKWWDWEQEKIIANKALFTQPVTPEALQSLINN